MFKLSWRQVFDTKIAGTTRDQAASVANEYGYDYFCRNGRLYLVCRCGTYHALPGLTAGEVAE